MADYLTISKHFPAFPEYLSFEVLRAIGIDHLQKLSSDLWTDYNLHDPGVTILEVLCYAVTDLGYRNNFDIQDLLAINPKDSSREEDNFFTPNQILTCNPATILDWRKRLIDIPGVRNAWIAKVEAVGDEVTASEVEAIRTRSPGHRQLVRPAMYANCNTEQLQFGRPDTANGLDLRRLDPRGLYDVCLDLEPEPHKDACGVVRRSRGKVLDEVQRVLCSYRNLAEDFRDIIVLGEEEIALCTDIELTADADPEDTLVEILVAVQTFLAPRLTFYTLQEMLAKGKTTAEIFAGRPLADLAELTADAVEFDCPAVASVDENGELIPLKVAAYPSHGFIDIDEIAALDLPEQIHTSDLYRVIMDVPGVAAIKKLSLINYINGLRQSEGHPWCLKLTEKHRPVLGVEQSSITFFKENLPFRANPAEVKQRYQEQQAAYIKAQKEPFELDLPIPRGRYYELADHYSIHHDFPLTYGISEDGLPDSVPAKRKAQAKQLKAYLIFFDQILASYLAQLSHIRDLFSWEAEPDTAAGEPPSDRRRTYFTGALANVPGGDKIIKNFYRCPGSDLPDEPPIDYPAYLDFITEAPQSYYKRRHQFLDHLLSRFSEAFTDYVLLNYQLEDGRRRPETDIINEKALFLKDYPVLGRDRFRAFNYCLCQDIWNSDNVSGFKKRVSRLIGIADFSRRNLCHYRVHADPPESSTTDDVDPPQRYRLVLSKPSSGDATSTADEAAVDSTSTDAQERDTCCSTTSANTSGIVFTSRTSYLAGDEAGKNAALELKQTALDISRYRRLAYRDFHHYGWQLTVGNKAISTVDQFHRDPNQIDTIRQELVAALLARQVTLQADTIAQLTSAVSDLQADALHIEEEQISLELVAPASSIETTDEAEPDTIAALLMALKATLQAAEAIDGDLIEMAFFRPILLANVQPDTAQVDLLAVTLTPRNPVAADAEGESTENPLPVLTLTSLLLTQQDILPSPAAMSAQVSDNLAEVDNCCAQFDEAIDEAEDVTIIQAIETYAVEPTNLQTILPEAALLLVFQPQGSHWKLDLTLPSTDLGRTNLPQRDAIAPLEQRLAQTLASDLVESAIAIPYLVLPRDEDNFFRFELEIPTGIAEHSTVRFIANQRQPSAQAAKSVAFQVLQRMTQQDNYCSMQVQQEDGTPAVFTYHGYGLTGTDGQLLADSCDRFLTTQERDDNLQQWLTCIQPHQTSVRVDAATECFFVEVRDRTGETVWLEGLIGEPTCKKAKVEKDDLLILGQQRGAYQLVENTSEETTTYSFRLTDLPQEESSVTTDRARHPIFYNTERERDLWLDTMLYYLNQLEPEPGISGVEGTYRATLLNREGAPLLTTYYSYATRSLAEIAYQRLLYLASDPVYFQPLNDLDGENPYGFELIDRRGRTFATHPGSYPTDCERDLAIRNIINYVNKEIIFQFPQREAQFYIQLLDQADTVLLVGEILYDSQEDAEAATEPLSELAQDASNYQLIDDLEGDCPYSYALMEGDTRIAAHPDSYALASERDRALQALISCIIDADPEYEISGDEGQFSYALRDVLAEAVADGNETSEEVDTEVPDAATPDSENNSSDEAETPTAPILLISAVFYPDRDSAHHAFEMLRTMGADDANYDLIDDLPAPDRYGFEVRDEAGEVIARHQTADGELIGYSSESERQAAIAKIIYYLTRPPIQATIVNPEGAFFAEIYDDQHELVWVGLRTLPSREAAIAEAQRIQALAGTPTPSCDRDPYPYTMRTGTGSCPYSFDLVDQTPSPNNAETDRETIIARHPRNYSSAAERKRVIQQLRLSFHQNLSSLIDTLTEQVDGCTQYRFALPASYFCAFSPCNANQQEIFKTASLLGPPLESGAVKTYSSSSEAIEAFLKVLPFAKATDNFHEIYDNAACNQNPDAQPFRFELRESPDGEAIAASPLSYRSRVELKNAIAFIQQLAEGFSFRTETPGTHCGVYFYLELPLPEGAEPVSLRSVNRYPSDARAWEAAAAFTENLRFLSRYLGPGEIDNRPYGFAIANEAGQVMAVTDAELTPVIVFQAINDLGDKLEVVPAAGDETGYQFQLVEIVSNADEEPTRTIWLRGVTVHPDEASARTQFYRDVLEQLFEDDAIAPYDTPGGFSFRITLAGETDAPSNVIAIHPSPDNLDEYRFYPTDKYRQQAIAQLKSFLLASNIDVSRRVLEPGFVGKILAEDGATLLMAKKRKFKSKQAAWQHGNQLMELAQQADNIRLIDDEDSTCFFSWELTDDNKYRVLGLPVQQYSSHDERKEEIAALQARVDDEGFHVLEHILLRPQQLLPPPLPCPPAPETAVSDASPPPVELEALLPIPLKKTDCEAGDDLCLTSYDPYSFWISIVMPYWPKRFRDVNFRQFVERTLRLEAPAHVALKICWVDVEQMCQFDSAYRHWIEQFSQQTCNGSACDLPGSQRQLVSILSNLTNVYPGGTLHDCDESGPEDNPIILNQTALGTTQIQDQTQDQ